MDSKDLHSSDGAVYVVQTAPKGSRNGVTIHRLLSHYACSLEKGGCATCSGDSRTSGYPHDIVESTRSEEEQLPEVG